MWGRFTEDELWEFLERATLGVWRYDFTAGEVEWSPALCRTLGVPREPRRLGSLGEYVLGADRERHDAAIRRFLRSGERVYSVDARFRFAGGAYRGATSHGVAWRDEEGRVVRAIGWLVDLSERRAELVARARVSARFRQIMEQCPVAFSITTTDGRFVYINPEGERVAGAPSAVLLGRRPADLVPPDTVHWIVESDRRVLEAGGTDRESGWITAADGVERYMMVTKFRIEDPASGEPQIASFVVDGTDLQRAREQSLALQRLESLGLLAGGVAHEFNNLLTIITSSVELGRMDPESAPMAHETIAEVTKRAADICRALLAYAGHDTEAMVAVDLGEMDGVLDLLKLGVVGGPALSVSVEPDSPTVRANPTELQRVLLNLVQNARDAAAESVQVTIGRWNEALPVTGMFGRPEGEGPYARILVRDDGEGIAADELDRIFDPFHSTKEEGAGLGLAVVHGIVRKHGGALRVSSRPGRTCLEVFLPILETGAAADREASARPVAGRHVLVVDDDAMIGRLVSRLLGSAGLRTTMVESGAMALERLASSEEPVDVILLDQSMPGMSGSEVLARLDERWPELPVIFSSGASVTLESDPSLAPRLVLPKPYTKRELVQAVEAALTPSR